MTEENLNTENEIEDPIEDVVAEVADDSYTEEVLPGSEYGDVTPPAPVLDGPAQAVGRRKEAIVRVRLVPGSGNFTLNGRTLEDYFPNKVHQQIVKSPLVNVEREEQFDIIALLRGGGPSGQAGATRLAIARALTVYSPDDRPSLKKAGYLTRDARAVERKKAGLKKARKAPQYSKR
ncbi:MAG TPA: 30S ribosomal protein S9 [Dietzia timorensis]|uniref:Small ribosomal subunit protein uS9 n=1 Tax=Dietzia timorensis TaxID=499555 RepID=A0A921F2B1_9ACTN|nr:30S ribosomal protein S9 [Dietzia timorensis]HJE90376.1 30S ribosomal protein S9 [Dietzia timorensis]